MLDLILKAIRSLFNKCEKMITEVAENLSWNNLKDKPFGDTVTITNLPETSFTFRPGAELEIKEPLQNSLLVGKTHIVNWNGTEYRCVARSINIKGVNATAIGNIAYIGIGADTGDPFIIVELPPEVAAEFGGTHVTMMALNGSDVEVTVSISCTDTEKIPEELLPFGDSKFLINATGNIGDEENWTADKSFMEAYSAASAGKMVVLHVGNSEMSWVYHLTSIWSSGALGFVCPLGGGNAYSVFYTNDDVFSDNLD